MKTGRKQLQPQSGSWERVKTANFGDQTRLPVEAKITGLDLCGQYVYSGLHNCLGMPLDTVILDTEEPAVLALPMDISSISFGIRESYR